MERPATRVGVIGCGNISGVYLLQAQKYDAFDIVACADLDMDRARTRAAEYGVPAACTVEELLADPHIELVLNLTIPQAHGEVALAALAAGKHVYNEKPLALSRHEAQRLLDQARARIAGRLCPRYLPRRRTPDVPQAHRGWLDR